MASEIGSSRRHTEILLETFLDRFPFPVCAGAHGYFVPETVDEINHYCASLKSRIRCISIRLRTVRRAAEKTGWRRENNAFVEAPKQTEFALRP